jgi:hypothetical protein
MTELVWALHVSFPVSMMERKETICCALVGSDVVLMSGSGALAEATPQAYLVFQVEMLLCF